MDVASPDRWAARDFLDAARGSPVAVALAALLSAGVAWLVHVGVVAARYEGVQERVALFEIIPGVGNRLWGYVVVLLWSLPIGLAIGLVLAGGWQRAGRVLVVRWRYLSTSVRAVGVRGQAAGLLAVATAAVGWVVLRSVFVSDDFSSGPAILSTSYAALLSVYMALFATAILGGGITQHVGSLLQRAAPRHLGRPHALGSVVVAGLAAGFALPVMFRSDLLVVLLCVGILGWAALRVHIARTASAAFPFLLLFAVLFLFVAGGTAAGDDGGWSECGGTLVGYLGCPGTSDVYADGWHAVPSGFAGGAMGAGVATALVARRDRAQRTRSPGAIRAVLRPSPAPDPTLSDVGPSSVAIGLEVHHDRGKQSLEELDE